MGLAYSPSSRSAPRRFDAHEARFEPAYRELVATLADSTWRGEYERLVEDPRRYRFLDAAQLVSTTSGCGDDSPTGP